MIGMTKLHSFDPMTFYCVDCGKGQDWIVANREWRACHGGGKVVGISHLVRDAGLRRVCEEILK